MFLSYIKFLINSTSEHGIHSPFVYRLVTSCFYQKSELSSYRLIKDYRKKLLKDHRKIKVTDFGAGSRVFSSEERKISAIAKNAGISEKRARLLNRLIPYFKIKTALELGTSVGISTAALAAGNNTKITTLEGCTNTASVAKEYFDDFNLQNIDLQVGEFQMKLNQLLKKKTAKNEKIDLIFFDGNHQKNSTLAYFKKLLPLTHNESVFIFDDIHWSREMEEAWEEIATHPQVTVSIDTFFWGIIFFRKEQKKQHFLIRM